MTDGTDPLDTFATIVAFVMGLILLDAVIDFTGIIFGSVLSVGSGALEIMTLGFLMSAEAVGDVWEGFFGFLVLWCVVIVLMLAVARYVAPSAAVGPGHGVLLGSLPSIEVDEDAEWRVGGWRTFELDSVEVERIRGPIEECYYCGETDTEGVTSIPIKRDVVAGFPVRKRVGDPVEDCIECFRDSQAETYRWEWGENRD